MQSQTPDLEDDLRPEYDFDFSRGERGRYYERLLKEGSNNMAHEPDVDPAQRSARTRGKPRAG